MPRPITRQHMEAFARALQAARTDATASPEKLERVQALHAGLQARDSGGMAWTVALRSLRWHRLEQNQWIAAEPPRELFLDDQVLIGLQEFIAPSPPVAFQGPPVLTTNPNLPPAPFAPPVQSAICHQCGAPLRANQKFCTKCGAKPATPTAVSPPQAPAPVAPVSPACPGCGRPIKVGQKFCTGCGTRLG
jgi:hypothetical protein